MNKKGFLLAGLSVGAIAVIVGGIILLLILLGIFAAVKWYLVAGVGLITLTIIYVIPSAMKGTFTKQKMSFILIMLLLGIGLILAPKLGLQSALGFNTLSISQGSFQSNIAQLNSEKGWLLTVAQGTLSQYAVGTFGSEDFPTTEKPDKPFTLEVKYKDQDCEYPMLLNENENPIYHLKYCQIDKPLWGFYTNLDSFILDAEKKCGITKDKILGYGFSASASLTPLNYQVISWDKKYYSGDFTDEDGFLYFSADVLLTVDGVISTKSIDNDPHTSTQSGGTLGDVGYVQWTGNLGSGLECPDGSSIKPIWTDQGWKLISKARYDEYNIKFITITPQSSIVSPFTFSWNKKQYSQSNLKQFVDDWNLYIASTLTPKTFGNIPNIMDINQGYVSITPEYTIQFPVLTLYLKASKLGIVTPSPKLQLISKSSECFMTGTEGSISVTVKNIGDYDGSWQVNGQCTGQFSLKQFMQISVAKGETKTITIPIQSSEQADATKSCTITFDGTNDLVITQNVCSEAVSTVCVANQYFCDPASNSIRKCDASGLSSTLSQSCPSGTNCVDINGNVQCKTGAVPGNATAPSCAWYQESYLANTKDCGFIGVNCWLGGGSVTTTSGCRFSTALAILIFALILVIVLVWGFSGKKGKRK